jgi:electron transport complex protein RnfB
MTTLADRIDALLPQTQCTKCGFTGCRPYAEAMAADEADINRCPPGGAAGIVKLALLLGREVKPLDPARGTEGPRRVALIDEAQCIGCTLCIQACPVDAIVGAPKLMHTVIAGLCTGCDLCLPPCPVDCISMPPAPPAIAGWDDAKADAARMRYGFRNARLAREQHERAELLSRKSALQRSGSDDAKRAAIQAAIERARARQASKRP